MKYVDEFREPRAAAALRGEIAALGDGVDGAVDGGGGSLRLQVIGRQGQIERDRPAVCYRRGETGR